MTILDSRAVHYARWCVQHDNPKAPHYVKLQAAQWLDIAEGRNTEALIDEKAYRRICKLLRLMVHPDLNCPMYDGLEDYAWLLITAVFCTKTTDGRRYYETALLEIARKNFKTFNSAVIFILLKEDKQMGLLKRFRRQEIRADPDETMFEDALLTALLGSGKATKQMALQVPTVSGGIDLIANVVAGTPVKLYREENGKAIEVPNDPRVRLLNDETGDTLNANEFWHAMIRDYYTGKGGYAYATLDAQYEKEQTELTAEISVLEKAIKSYEKHEKDADRFIALIDKYENFDKLTIAMLNEFIEKILVHERDRKGSIQTTQEVEIYFNFVGRFVPPAFGEVELTPEELEEIRKREERKDRLHQNYLKRKANGKQKEYEERTKAKKKAEIEARKQAIRTEDIARGVFIPVSSLPQLGPRKGA